MDAAEWLESAEEANKRTVVGRSTYSRPSGRQTGQKHGGNGSNGGKNGGDKNGKNGGSPDRKKGKGSNPRCPESEGTGSKCPPPRAQPTDPGYVYIIEMAGSDGDISPPPPVMQKPDERRGNLIAGNPFRLEFAKRFKVCNKAAAENLAKAALRDLKFRVSGGGTEWYKLPSGGIASFARMVECAIDEYLDVNNGGGSSSRGGASSSRGRGRHDFLSLPINPCLAPKQEGAVMSPNNGHFNPPFPGIGNTKWRQALKGNVLQIKVIVNNNF